MTLAAITGKAPVPEQMGLALGDAAAPPAPAGAGALMARFVVPPFSVLDARQGYWQERKRAWLALGIRSELGRGANHLGLSAEVEDYRRGAGDYAKAGAARPEGAGGPGTLGREYAARERPATAFNTDCVLNAVAGDTNDSGTSIFDPVLCELVYRWFCPPGGAVLDPFAGGSVRGVVAAWLGYAYTGVDLRPVQVAANQQQAAEILDPGMPPPVWLAGDSRALPALLPPGAGADLVFTCPPYHDLERYSDDPRDLSNAGDYAAFLDGYGACLRNAAARLRPDRFLAVVVGNVRDARGGLLDLGGDTTRLLADAGLALFNDAVLVTMVGSLPVRAARQFPAGRKLGRSHQQVLVYVKGDPGRAARSCAGAHAPAARP